MKKLFLLLVLCTLANIASEKPKKDKEDDIPAKEGNLTLPGSQQPNPLFCFGQNIVDKGDLLAIATIDYLKGKKKHFNDFIPTILYGISDTLSLFVYQPFANFKENGHRSSGPEDTFVQFEYAFHTKKKSRYYTQTTLVGTLILPSGSVKKQPPTGFGSPSVFLGLTASFNHVEWYAFASPGVILTTPHHGTKFGNIFFYEWGIGRNILYIPQKLLLTGIIEFFGIYRQKDKFNKIIDPNTGSNVFWIGPSFWLATEQLILQGGIAFPAAQHFSRTQTKNSFYAALYLGWKFNT